MVGGDGVNIGAEQTPLSTPLKQGSVYGRATYDLTDNLQAFLEVSYAYSRTRFPLSAHRDLAAITIRRDNPYLPASVVALMAANNLQTFTMGRLSPDTGMNVTDNKNGTERYIGGFTGKVFGDWTWDSALRARPDPLQQPRLREPDQRQLHPGHRRGAQRRRTDRLPLDADRARQRLRADERLRRG